MAVHESLELRMMVRIHHPQQERWYNKNMCDTLIATSKVTKNKVSIFAKNSDRHPNEGQSIVFFPSKTNQESVLKCTYIEIPQVHHTNAVLLSKPFWMWGAEMGVNEHGLVIGNEAVFSKEPANKQASLLGMDMLRIALERATTPLEGIQVITDLLEQHGQGGNCAFDKKFYYHNSFILADSTDAWVLETVGKQWAAKQINDIYTISNGLTIQNEYDLSSKDLVEFAIKKGYTKSAKDFHFADDYSDFVFTKFGKGRERRETTFDALYRQRGDISVETMMQILRHHKDGPFFNPEDGLSSIDVCMHAGFGPIRGDQTTASMVVYLDGNKPLVFVTGTAAPCTSIFKPVWMDTIPTLNLWKTPSSHNDFSYYWMHEELHRSILRNYQNGIKTFKKDRDDFENNYIEMAFKLHNKPNTLKERQSLSSRCFEESVSKEAMWLMRVDSLPSKKSWLYSKAWKKFNDKASIP